MKEILETIINTLVSDKDAVSINQVDGEQSIIFEVKVAENDMGKIIGKQGTIAKSIRTTLYVANGSTVHSFSIHKTKSCTAYHFVSLSAENCCRSYICNI